jgi:hypothetical protein
VSTSRHAELLLTAVCASLWCFKEKQAASTRVVCSSISALGDRIPHQRAQEVAAHRLAALDLLEFPPDLFPEGKEPEKRNAI